MFGWPHSSSATLCDCLLISMFIFNTAEKMSQRTSTHDTKVSAAAHLAITELLLVPYNILCIRQALQSKASDFCNLFNRHYPFIIIGRIIVPLGGGQSQLLHR